MLTWQLVVRLIALVLFILAGLTVFSQILLPALPLVGFGLAAWCLSQF